MVKRLPKYHVLRETPEGWVHALWPEGEPAWRVSPDPARAQAAAVEDADELAAMDPEGAVHIVVDPEGVEVYRAESFASVPF